MHRFYLPPHDFHGDYAISSNPELLHQLNNVLRFHHGDKVILFDGSGDEYTGQLVELTKKYSKFILIDQQPAAREPLREIVLYQALIKADKFDWLLQKVTEIGAARIVPVITSRSVVKGISPAKRQRLELIIKEAVEQCGGTKLPILSEPMNFVQALEETKKLSGAKVIAWEGQSDYQLADLEAQKIQIFVGPEGGFSPEEIALAQENNLVPVTLGRRILRAETAAIVALAKLL